MAAEMAVESTAREEIQTEDRHQIVQEDHLTVDHQTAQEDHSERVTREEATEATVREEASARAGTVHREGLTVRAEIVREDHVSEKDRQVVTVHREDHTARALKEEHSEAIVHREDHTEKVLREGHMEETVHREEAMATVLKEEVSATVDLL